jgi:hypothetical protein
MLNLPPLQKNTLLSIPRRLQVRKKKGVGKVPAIERLLLLEDPFSIESLRLANSIKPQEVGALLLMNSKKVECDPSSRGLDVGILSCGAAGQHSCQESAVSLLGGFCVIEAEGARTCWNVGFGRKPGTTTLNRNLALPILSKTL